MKILGRHLTNNTWLYALTWAVAVVLFLAAWALLESRFGRALRAVRDSEVAALALGVNRSAYKVAAFGVSAAYAGVAGALFAINVAYVSPDTFPISLSLYLLVAAVVGFFGSIWGALLGALLIQFLSDIVGVIPHVDTKQAGPTTFVFGLLLVVLMLVLPLVVRLGAAVAIDATLVLRWGGSCRRPRSSRCLRWSWPASPEPPRPPRPACPRTRSRSARAGPLTGEAAAAAGVLRGADAYFKYVNGRGGVFGRKIKFTYLDDGYDPSRRCRTSASSCSRTMSSRSSRSSARTTTSRSATS